MSLSFSSLTADSAPAAARAMLSASQTQFGFLPSPVARGAHAPGVLKHLLASFMAFDQTTLSPLEREIIAMTVAFEHSCHYCMAMHSALQAGDASAASVVAALREGAPIPDRKLETLHAYTRALVRDRGHVDAALADAFVAAGYTEAQALEVVLGIAVYTLSTLMNAVTNAPLDPPFAAFAWEPPAARGS